MVSKVEELDLKTSVIVEFARREENVDQIKAQAEQDAINILTNTYNDGKKLMNQKLKDLEMD